MAQLTCNNRALALNRICVETLSGWHHVERPPKTEIHCEIVEIRIIVDCIQYAVMKCNFVLLCVGDLSP